MKLQNLIHILIGIACIGLLPQTQAVVPAPEGGYPGGNTAEGQSALFSLTSGGFNTAVGFLSESSTTTGSFNTAIGAGTLLANTGDNNTATGAGALLNDTTGTANTAVGAFALFSNTTADNNTAVGANALLNNTRVNQGGDRNTATGSAALYSNTTGFINTASGYRALYSNTTGAGNTANGAEALFNSTGDQNTANGYSALTGNTVGFGNTASGFFSLAGNTTGNANTAMGIHALYTNTTGSNNTALGADAGTNVTTADNVLCIGTQGANVTNSCFIGNIRGVTTANADAIPVLIDSVGQLGTISSSRRFKKEIKPMDDASESILALKPVTFHYKSDATNTPQFGLIAEEVASVSPDLVVRDKNGDIYSVRYDAVNAMLLNEFLKEHKAFIEEQRKVQEQQATITQLKQDFQSRLALQQKQIEALTTGLQKVSEQIQMSRPAPQVVNNK
jgi:hypothetical protein